MANTPVRPQQRAGCIQLSGQAEVLAALGAKYEFGAVQPKLEDACRRPCPEKIECLYANGQDHSLSVH